MKKSYIIPATRYLCADDETPIMATSINGTILDDGYTGPGYGGEGSSGDDPNAKNGVWDAWD